MTTPQDWEGIMHPDVLFDAARRRSRLWLLCALPFVLMTGAPPAKAQGQMHAVPPQGEKMPMDKAVKMMDADPDMKKMPMNQRMSVMEFVAGNLVFVLQHEMGHAQISERKLAVLGARDEDAADVFAILTMLEMGNVMSYRVLEQAAMGWFLTAKRQEKQGDMLEFYEAHGLDKQRAYQIVCLMVGYDKDMFKQLADDSKLPKSRRESCGADYRFAQRGWEATLAPHRRAPDQEKTKIDIMYEEAKGKLKVFADGAQAARLLENLRDYAADTFQWNAPFKIVMKSCGQSNANWNPFTRQVTLCYEMAQELAELYVKYGKEMKPAKKKKG
jgi:Putative metallopeptidase